MSLSESSLQRRVKRYFNRRRQRFFIPCAPGLEALLAAEVAELLAEDATDAAIHEVHGGLELTGHVYLMYRLNLWLRTGNRVLLRIGDFWANSLPALFGHAQRLPWEVFLGFHDELNVRTASTRSRLSTGSALTRTLVDAINVQLSSVDRNVRLAEDPIADAPTVFLRVFEDRVTLSLDTSGDLLYKRGYRASGGAAPIRPTVAAALLRFSSWGGSSPLVDPLCGSGTIPIEAVLLRDSLPPGGHRSFAFETLPFHNASLWGRLHRDQAVGRKRDAKIVASDIADGAVRIAQENAALAKVGRDIDFRTADVMDLTADALGLQGQRGALVMNMPYGKRIPAPITSGNFAHAAIHQLASRFDEWRLAMAVPQDDTPWDAILDGAEVLDTTNGGLPISFVRGNLRRR